MKKANDPVRLNLQMSEEIIAFYQELAEEIGIPRSGVMVMALKMYMDEQKALRGSSQRDHIDLLIERLEKEEDDNELKFRG